jgi:perosamine synthetase
VIASRDRLAVHGGKPVRETLLPYARQTLDEHDVRAVVGVLGSDWLTTGPKVLELEAALAKATGAREAVVFSHGTAALHAAMAVAGIGPGDEVLVPAMTFVATANCVAFQGGRPVFVDVDRDTLLIDCSRIEACITSRTRAIIAVDYAGQPCDYDWLHAIAAKHELVLVSDACHALGACWRGRRVGTLSHLTAFSFHPVKHVTTGEGGAVTTDDSELAGRMRRFRNHGIDTEWPERTGSLSYDMVELGHNYRLTDMQCALGISQLRHLAEWLNRRREIAARYDEAFRYSPHVAPLATMPAVEPAYHLYVVRMNPNALGSTKSAIMAALHAEGIGVRVHYPPAHLHSFYRRRFATGPGLCPIAEAAYEEILSLPLFPAMSDRDVEDVVAAVHKVANGLAA